MLMQSQPGAGCNRAIGPQWWMVLEALNPARLFARQASLFFVFASAASAAADTFSVVNTNQTGAGSLRQAILDANATPGTNLIQFAITNPTPSITITNPLPDITNPVVIDGTTQSGFSNSPIVELNGANFGTAQDGLRINTSNSIIRGLVINRFTGDGIEVTNASGIVIEGNIVGLNVAGTADLGNGREGVLLTNSLNCVIGGIYSTRRNFICGNQFNGISINGSNATNNLVIGNVIGLGVTNGPVGNSLNGVLLSGSRFNTIGGLAPAERNIISANFSDGVEITGTTTLSNIVQGNFIGTEITGTIGQANNANGVYLNGAPNNLVGGTSPGAANLISRNQSDGVEISGLTATNNFVLGNWIGLDVSGATNLGNSGHGIFITSNARINFIGATNSAAGNRIAFNSGDGVYVQTGTNNTIRGNSIWTNTGLGIDLDNDGVTANDPGDPDVGNANFRQNFPVITNAVLNVGSTLIQGTNNSLPNSTFLLDFYANAGPDPTGNGEGQLYLGSTTVTTGPDGNAVFSVNLPVTVTMGRWITATATDTNGNTSEFSAAYQASATLPGATFTVINTNDVGSGSFRQALLDASALPTGSPHLIQFAIPGSGPRTITLANPVPALLEPLIIDGFTQSGSTSNTLANGNNANQLINLRGLFYTGLRFITPSNVVRGIVFTAWPAAAVELASTDGVVEGCLFGLTPDGTVSPNVQGVLVSGNRNRIGGTAPEQRVVIAGNGNGVTLSFISGNNIVRGCFVGTGVGGTGATSSLGTGIALDGTNNIIGGAMAGARNVVCGYGFNGMLVHGAGHSIQGNFVGVDATGTNVFANQTSGINLVSSANNLIGGATLGAGNVISGNLGPGVGLSNTDSTNNVVQGNFVGTDLTGTLALGNSTHGIVSSGSANFIGGINAGEGNVIAFNGEGVHLNFGVNNPIRGNSIHSNGGRGIALGNFLNFNDPNDDDPGPNNLQNFPTLTNAAGTLAGTTIQGSLQSRSNTTYQLDFYSSIIPDVANRGEGQKYLGSTNVTTGPTGIGAFSVTVPSVMYGRQISATATDPDGNTSEFSDCIPATSTLPAVTNVVVNTNDSGAGSLRQALLNAGTNAAGSPNPITFNIPGAGPHTIKLLSALSAPIEWVAIDSFTQPGASANTSTNGDNAVRKIVLDGSLASYIANCLAFEAKSNLVCGLTIQGVYGNAITFNTNSGGNVIEGCFITGSSNSAVLINSANNRLGGTSAAARNIFSGNADWGISLSGASARGNLIAGNFIGPDATGTNSQPNAQGGILISDAATNTIGGSATGRNFISGNGAAFFTGPGIQITGAGASNNVVQGNFVGLGASGDALGNKGPGVLITSSANGTLIGPPSPPAGAADLQNVIAWNDGAGVDVLDGDRHNIRANLIFENGALGINLGLASPQLNDPGDGDLGPNQLQNYPVITNATITASNVNIRGTLNSHASTAYALDFFSTSRPDASGYGEAEAYLGSTNVTTDGSGNVAFNVTFAGTPVGEYINATATDETSEESPNFHANVVGVTPQNFTITTGVGTGPGSAPFIFNLANQKPGLDNIAVDPSTGTIYLPKQLNITSPVNFNGDLGGGQNVVISGENMTGSSPLLTFSDTSGNTVQNVDVVSTPGDAVFFNKSGGNDINNVSIGAYRGNAYASRGGVGGSALIWQGIPFDPPTNTVRNVRITNVRANGLQVAAGNKVVLGASNVFQSIVSSPSQFLPISTVSFVQKSLSFGVSENGNGTINSTWRVNGTTGQSGQIHLYQWEGAGGSPPSFSGLGRSVASADYTIPSGTFTDVIFTLPKPTHRVGLATLHVTDSDTSLFSLMEENVPYLQKAPKYFNSANLYQSASTREPVNLFTGEYFDLLAPDLDLGGPLPVLFQRYYGSFLQRDGRAAGRLGFNWLHNYEWALTNKTSTVEIVSPMGRVITFTNSGGNYLLLGRQDVPFQLAASGPNLALGDPESQLLHTFNAAGQLIRTTDGRGNTNTLTYAGNLLTSVSDSLGRTLTFQYHPSGFLTNVSDGTRSVGFTQSNTNLIASRDALGKVSTNLYAVAAPHPGLLTDRNRPLGNSRFKQTYDEFGRVSQQRQAGALHATEFAYGFNLCVQTDPDDFVREFYHNDNGEFTAFADEANQASTMTYNASGQRASLTDRRGNTTRTTYHSPSGRVAAVTNADGTVVQFSYTNRNLGGITFHDLSKVTYPDGTAENFTYDANGNVTAITDRAGKISRFSHNARGQPLAATNPAGGVVTFTYNADGTTATAADSETGATSFFYDGLKRLTNIVHPDGTSRRWQFDLNDRLLSATDERTNSASFTYDANDRLVRIVDGNGDSAGFAYDNADRIVTVTNAAGATATIEYDDRGHVIVVTDFSGNPTYFAVDARHRLASLSRDFQTWQLGYNNEAQLTSVTNPQAQADRFTRDALGFTTGATNPLGQASAFVLDVMRRLTNSVDPLLRSFRYGYDARGILTNAIWPAIGGASFELNDLGLLTKIIGLNGEQWKFAYSPLGRLLSVADPLNRTNRLGYDNRGRRISTTFADGTTLTNTLDGASLVTRRHFSTGPDITYAYDKLGRLTNVTGSDPVVFAYDSEGRITNTLSSGVNFGAGYDGAGRLVSVTYSNGAFTVTYGYNFRDELTSVSDNLTGTLLQFLYDAAGRLTNISRPNLVNTDIAYDAAGRLTRIREGNFVDIQYALDAAGQVVQAGFTAPLDPAALITNSQATAFTHDAAHQINSAGYNYDARGRLIASPGQSFTWDGASRLTGIGAVTLGYDGMNQIITRTESGATTRFFYNHAVGMSPIMAERDEAAMEVHRYYVYSPAGRLLYLIDAANGNAVRHFHLDRVGSTLALTSAAGAVTDAYAYTLYGELLGRTGTNTQPFTYIGAYGVRSEPAANLYQMRARYYDPVSARFLSRDPLWPRLDGLDPYLYALENPLVNIDPLGLQAQGPAFTCVANAGVPLALRAEGLTELVGEVVLNCTGGNPSITPGLPAVNFQVFLNTTITSRLLSSGAGSQYAEQLLFVDDSGANVLPIAVAFNSSANNLPALGTSTINGSFAPLSTVATASGSAPIPRFVDGSVNRNLLNINICQTSLLYPFVANQQGFDTGLAIANTSQDPFGTRGSSQASFSYFSGGANSLSSGGNLGIAATPGFQGYVIAQCQYQFAHGFAFISDFGASRLAQGYLALVLDQGPCPSKPAAGPETLGQ